MYRGMAMFKKSFAVFAAALMMGAIFRNKQNRQFVIGSMQKLISKMTVMTQVNSQASQQHSQLHHTLRDVAEAPAGTSTLTIDKNAMVYEGGAQTAIFQYNEEQAKQPIKYH